MASVRKPKRDATPSTGRATPKPKPPTAAGAAGGAAAGTNTKTIQKAARRAKLVKAGNSVMNVLNAPYNAAEPHIIAAEKAVLKASQKAAQSKPVQDAIKNKTVKAVFTTLNTPYEVVEKAVKNLPKDRAIKAITDVVSKPNVTDAAIKTRV